MQAVQAAVQARENAQTYEIMPRNEESSRIFNCKKKFKLHIHDLSSLNSLHPFSTNDLNVFPCK